MRVLGSLIDGETVACVFLVAGGGGGYACNTISPRWAAVLSGCGPGVTFESLLVTRFTLIKKGGRAPPCSKQQQQRKQDRPAWVPRTRAEAAAAANDICSPPAVRMRVRARALCSRAVSTCMYLVHAVLASAIALACMRWWWLAAVCLSRNRCASIFRS